MTGVSAPYKKLGAWQDGWSPDTVYQAATDGFVIVLLTENATCNGYTDSDPAPDTLRATCEFAGGVLRSTINMPVKKNDFWKITVTTGTPTIYWIPLKP